MVSWNVEGVIAPVFTPVHRDGSLNLTIIPQYMSYLVSHGVRGILVGGTTGESVTLSLEERKNVLEAWLLAAWPLEVKVIAQVGGVPMPEVIEMAKYAERFQADAIMTLPEIYYKPQRVEHLVTYLKTVSEAAPTLPLLYYHFPMMSGVELNVPELFSLASSKIPNFKGMKANLGAAVQVTDLLKKDQRIFIGNHMISPAVLLGHESSIATVTNLFPSLVLRTVDATRQGDVTKVRELQGKINKLVSTITAHGEFLPSMKASMSILSGLDMGPPRQPMAELDDVSKHRLRDNLAALGIHKLNLHLH